MTRIEQIISSLEKGPSTDIDGRIGVVVDRLSVARVPDLGGSMFDQYSDEDGVVVLPSYSSSVDAALSFLDRRAPGWRVRQIEENDDWIVVLSDGVSEARAGGSTLAHALCLSTLRAIVLMRSQKITKLPRRRTT